MKIYIVKGYGYDGFEQCKTQYAEIFMSREEAEEKVNEIAKEQVQYVSCENGMNYYETFYYKNGVLTNYILNQYCDLQKPLQKEAYVFLSGFARICSVDEFVPNIETPSDAHKDVKVACVSIEEIELK